MTVYKLSTVLVLLLSYYAFGQDQETNPACFDGDLQLVNTTRIACTTEQPTELQVCIDGKWYSACAKNWSGRLSRMICRQLGLSTGYRLSVGNNSERVLATAALVDCRDEQEDLSECSRKGSCSARDVIHLKCIDDEMSLRQGCGYDGDIRLKGSEMANRGNLEVCQFDVWGSVCNTDWSEANSNVACRQLGFTAGTGTENKASTRVIEECTTPIHTYNVTCSGEEDSLVNCPHNRMAPMATPSYNNNTCGIFLTCSVPKVNCKDGDLRLFVLNPRVPGQGWLLICFNEEWRTLCDNGWDFLDSTVACRQLGYVGGFHCRFELPLELSQKEMYAIHADNVRCTGNETRLIDCLQSTTHSCFHTQDDVFLICKQIGDGCDNGDVRLVDGPSAKEGQLEFCWNDIWGAVCNTNWVRRDTNVTCRQLGLYTGYEERKQLLPTDIFPTLIEQTNCSGSEQRLADCAFRFAPAYACPAHKNDVFLRCLGEGDLADCKDGDLKLVGGRNSGEGLLKICHQKVWGTICGNKWNESTDSLVACRQLGFHRSVSPQYTVGEARNPIHFTNFMCNGTEQSLTECSYEPVELYITRPMCDHSRDIHLACQDPILGSSTSTIIAAYALIPFVLLLIGSVVIVCIVVFLLKFRNKDQDQQPRQDTSLLHTPQARPDLSGQLYRNAGYTGYTEDTPTPNSMVTMFPEGHYMMSESVMGHIYESIDDDDTLKARYNGEYSLVEREEDTPGAKCVAPYDKLEKNSSLKTAPGPYDLLNRKERSTQECPNPYEKLERPTGREDRGYNKLQRKKHEVKQLTGKDEDYEQIDLSKNLANN